MLFLVTQFVLQVIVYTDADQTERRGASMPGNRYVSVPPLSGQTPLHRFWETSNMAVYYPFDHTKLSGVSFPYDMAHFLPISCGRFRCCMSSDHLERYVYIYVADTGFLDQPWSLGIGVSVADMLAPLLDVFDLCFLCFVMTCSSKLMTFNSLRTKQNGLLSDSPVYCSQFPDNASEHQRVRNHPLTSTC